MVTTASVIALGDNLYHGSLLQAGQNDTGEWNYEPIYVNVKDEIQKADLAIVDQETVLTGAGRTEFVVVMAVIFAVLLALMVYRILKPKAIIDEAEKNGEKLGRKGLYKVMIRFVAPALLLWLFLISLGIL